VEIAVDREARILGVRGTLTHEAGAYMPWGVVLPWIAATSVPGPYVIPSFHLDVSVAFTNKVPTSPVRGAGMRGISHGCRRIGTLWHLGPRPRLGRSC